METAKYLPFDFYPIPILSPSVHTTYHLKEHMMQPTHHLTALLHMHNMHKAQQLVTYSIHENCSQLFMHQKVAFSTCSLFLNSI